MVTYRNTDLMSLYPLDSRADYNAALNPLVHGEIDLRGEFEKTIYGSFGEIAKGMPLVIRRLRRDPLTFARTKCDCTSGITGEPDLDTTCPFCVKRGTYVPTSHGVVPIETIVPGDKVLTKDNGYQTVLKTYARLYNGTMVSISTAARASEPLETTADHPVFVFRPSEPCHQKRSKNKLCNVDLCSRHCKNKKALNPVIQEMRADEVRIGDYLIAPYKPSVANHSNQSHLSVDWRKYASRKKDMESPSLPSLIKIDEDLMTFLGWYVAEGSGDAPSRKSRIVIFSLHQHKEQHIAHMLISIANKKFGLNGFIKNSKISKSTSVVICNSLLSRWMHDLCGRYSDHKKVPKFIWKLFPDLKQVFLDSFIDGDGHVDVGYRCTTGIASRQLAEEVYALALELGYFPYIMSRAAYIGSDGTNHNDSWYVQWLDSRKNENGKSPKKWREKFLHNNNVFMRVKNISKRHEICAVYDLTVENDHSFIANGVAVHNCLGDGYYWSEEIWSGYKVAGSLRKLNYGEIGIIADDTYRFYLPYNANLIEGDSIIELVLDVEGQIDRPMRRIIKWKPTSIENKRLDNGRTEFFIVTCSRSNAIFIEKAELSFIENP